MPSAITVQCNISVHLSSSLAGNFTYWNHCSVLLYRTSYHTVAKYIHFRQQVRTATPSLVLARPGKPTAPIRIAWTVVPAARPETGTTNIYLRTGSVAVRAASAPSRKKVLPTLRHKAREKSPVPLNPRYPVLPRRQGGSGTPHDQDRRTRHTDTFSRSRR